MKTPVIAAILLVLAVPAHARMRHDRICDMVQDKFDVFSRVYNPNGAHFVRFGRCEGTVFDDDPDGIASLAGMWGSLSCGYQAYREGKKLTGSPYKNLILTEQWKGGWKSAREACATGKLPIFNSEDLK